MDLNTVKNLIREVSHFEFSQSNYVYELFYAPDKDAFTVYGTGRGSNAGHNYGNYSVGRIAEWLKNRPNKEKINGQSVEDFYLSYLDEMSSSVDVFSVL